jgi:hypothetical protein
MQSVVLPFPSPRRQVRTILARVRNVYLFTLEGHDHAGGTTGFGRISGSGRESVVAHPHQLDACRSR